MDKATERIIKALNDKEKILIYGDYDVDGSTSVAMIFDFFSLFTNYISYVSGYHMSLTFFGKTFKLYTQLYWLDQ